MLPLNARPLVVDMNRRIEYGQHDHASRAMR